MVVLLTGATGFIGGAIRSRLWKAGHHLMLVTRGAAPLARPRERWVAADFRSTSAAEWETLLRGVDAVVNAAGIFRERGDDSFAAVHTQGPAALFHACVAQGIQRVIQISALGADADAVTAFHRSKRRADDLLLEQPINALVLQPSLVFGKRGQSARFFLQIATWPLLPLPGGGRQYVQPVHVNDLADAVGQALASPGTAGRLAAVGPEPLALREYIAILARSMGERAAPVVSVPMRWAQFVGGLPGLRQSWLSRDGLSMLARGNCADAAPFRALLGQTPRAAAGFLAPDEQWVADEPVMPAELLSPEERQFLITEAKLQWLLPLLRFSIAIVWLAAGIVSLGIYPISASLALLNATGASGAFAYLMLFGAAGLDLLFGIGTLVLARRHRQWLWPTQIAVMGLYTAVITVALPEFWLHPYGPIVKNLPLLMAIVLLMKLEAPARRPDGISDR